MADILLPTHLNHARVSFRYLDATGLTVNPYTGAVRTASLGGDRVGASLEFVPTRGADAAQTRHAIQQLRGRQNRVYLFDQSYTRRGSFSAGEILINPTFANGTTGWITSPDSTISAADRILRSVRSEVDGVNNTFALIPQNTITGLTQYAPYAARYMVQAGLGSAFTDLRVYENVSGQTMSATGNQNSGLLTGVTVISGTTILPGLVDGVISGPTPGDYFSISYTSAARCILADGGGNALQQSDTLGTTWSQTGLSALNSNAGAAPDGTTTADSMVENGSAGGHSINQSQSRTNVAADLCGYGFFKRNSGTRNVRVFVGNDGSNGGSAIFDLGGGTFSTVTNHGTATNARAFIENKGNGWYFCSVVARLPAATTIQVFAEMASGTTVSYTGDGASSIFGWRVGGTPSSVPTRGTQSIASAVAAASQQGTGIHVKGLPASTNGLLEICDWIEVITSRGSELKMVTARLNSDAAGLGYLQVLPPCRGTVANDAAIIVHQPMGRFVCMSADPGWDNEPGVFTRASLEFAEATD